MKLIKEKQVDLEMYAKCKEELVDSSKTCNQRDLSCSFRPTILMAPPR